MIRNTRKHAEGVLRHLLEAHSSLQPFVVLDHDDGYLTHFFTPPSNADDEFEGKMLGDLSELLDAVRPTCITIVCPGIFIRRRGRACRSHPGVIIVDSCGHWWTQPEVLWLSRHGILAPVPYREATCLLRPMPPLRKLYA
jgi:hypothetical protein